MPGDVAIDSVPAGRAWTGASYGVACETTEVQLRARNGRERRRRPRPDLAGRGRPAQGHAPGRLGGTVTRGQAGDLGEPSVKVWPSWLGDATADRFSLSLAGTRRPLTRKRRSRGSAKAAGSSGIGRRPSRLTLVRSGQANVNCEPVRTARRQLTVQAKWGHFGRSLSTPSTG